MDAVEFLKAINRMYKTNADTFYICLLSASNSGCLFTMANEGNENIVVDKVEQWAKEHPVKTRQSEFLKMYPNASIASGGVLYINPCVLDKIRYNEGKCANECYICRRDYWLQEIE